jgi:hypothetical protein
LKASTVLMSGSGVPALTTTPTPVLARSARLPGTTLPSLTSPSIASGVSTATSNFSSPLAISFMC